MVALVNSNLSSSIMYLSTLFMIQSSESTAFSVCFIATVQTLTIWQPSRHQ